VVMVFYRRYVAIKYNFRFIYLTILLNLVVNVLSNFTDGY